MRRRLAVGCALLVIGSLPAMAAQGYGPLIAHGLDPQLATGADLFFSETFGGNGRTCATCHKVDHNYTLQADLSNVSASDPLMIADPDNPAFVPNLELCDPNSPTENCQAIRQNGLILENRDDNLPGSDGARSYVMRSVPHLLSMATSLEAPAGPFADATGWASDGAPGDGSLRQFAAGAAEQHFTHDVARNPGDFPVLTDDELDAMDAFQRQLGRLEDINLASVTMLDDNAISGQVTFSEAGGRCSRCHNNAGALSGTINQNFDTNVEELRMFVCENSPLDPGQCAPASAQIVAGASFDGGRGLDPDPNGEAIWGDGTFNTPPLIEAADTPPFFHDNADATLETAIGFYRTPQFLDSPACAGITTCGLEGTPAGGPERNLGAMLRVLNAGFNLSMGAQRLHEAYNLLNTEPGTDPSVAKVLTLAKDELVDARTVIHAKFLGTGVFANTGNHILDAYNQLGQTISDLDNQITNGAEGLEVAVLLTQVIGVANNHLSDDFYDESPTRCADRGVTVSQGEYNDCRWLYDLGSANVVFDDAGVTPSIVSGATDLTWSFNSDGSAKLTMTWQTAEWSNPLFDKTVLSDISPNPSFSPITFTGNVTQLSNGDFQRTFTYTFPCVPGVRKYQMDVTARVGGVTETDSDTAKSPGFCLAP